MKKLLCILLLVPICSISEAKILKKIKLTGMYLQWGYNRDAYSKSDIRFYKSNGQYDFMLYNVKAKDQPDFGGFYNDPLDITIPQNAFRIGFYLNASHTHMIEINYDHAKYVMEDNQLLHMKGQVNGVSYEGDTTIVYNFVHFQHTNGANFYEINYVGQHELWNNGKKMSATFIWKAGAGLVIPRTIAVIMYHYSNNPYHVAGYMGNVETGLRFYPGKHFFLEATGKAGYANYLDAQTADGGKASHHFYFAEILGLAGYDINFRKKKKVDVEVK